ncbi:MAG: hypothetical protein KJO15_08880 [Alphaproteobacteria bacterium]|nr:hypothetical protein [Alphaproteobacteria bacterium]
MHRPWHFWPVTVLAVLWFAGASADYALTQYRADDYLALFTEDQIAYFTNMPVRVDAAWAVGAWGGLIGAVMMLAGWRRSALILAISAGAMTFVAIWLLALSDPPMRIVTGLTGDVVIASAALVSILFWLYARWLHARGQLP